MVKRVFIVVTQTRVLVQKPNDVCYWEQYRCHNGGLVIEFLTAAPSHLVVCRGDCISFTLHAFVCPYCSVKHGAM